MSVLLIAIVYWIIIYVMSIVPNLSNNYYVNIMWMTIIIPNMLRLIVGSIPRLAVDRVIFLSFHRICLHTHISTEHGVQGYQGGYRESRR